MHLYEELGDTSRRRLLSELRTGPKTVTELVDSTSLKQPNVSNHLARMRSKGILRAAKVGRQVFYSFATPQIETAVRAAFIDRDMADGSFDVVDASKRYAKSATQGNESACVAIVEHALKNGLTLMDIYQDVLLPAMVSIGTWYLVDAIDTAQEHLASAITERIMGKVVQHAIPAKSVNRTAILGCGPNSWHVIGLRMVADYLHLSGWKALFLGANMPVKCFVSSVEQHNPDLVLVSCMAEEGLEPGLELVKKLNDLRNTKTSFALGVGGLCVSLHPEQFKAAGADFSCSCLKSFAEVYLPQVEENRKSLARK